MPELVWKIADRTKPTPSRQDESLLQTVSRELREETGIGVDLADIKPVRKAVFTELDTGYVQFVALGINIPRARITNGELRPEEKEGYVKQVPFEHLAQLVRDPSVWVPTGLVHVLLWLGSAVQSNGTQFVFGTETGEQLVRHTIEELDRRECSDTSVLNY